MTTEPALVPELLVTDLDASLRFWVDLCGFTVAYDRPDERFAFLTLGSAYLMLEQVGVGRNWLVGPLAVPFGRGMNLQVTVTDSDAIATRLVDAGVALFMQPETKWYRTGETEAGVRQFLVADPDGYLIRFQSSTEHRDA